MNTANLQHEGLLLAIASLLEVLERKGIATRAELDEALARAENHAASPTRPRDLSPSNVDAICFPIRFLRLALATPGEAGRGFAEIATEVALTKPGH
jgi:hypothetical protein